MLLMISVGLFWARIQFYFRFYLVLFQIFLILQYKLNLCVLQFYYLQNSAGNFQKAAKSRIRIYMQTSLYTPVNSVEPTHSH